MLIFVTSKTGVRQFECNCMESFPTKTTVLNWGIIIIITFSTVSYVFCSSDNFPTCVLATVGSALQDKMKNNINNAKILHVVVRNLDNFKCSQHCCL